MPETNILFVNYNLKNHMYSYKREAECALTHTEEKVIQ